MATSTEVWSQNTIFGKAGVGLKLSIPYHTNDEATVRISYYVRNSGESLTATSGVNCYVRRSSDSANIMQRTGEIRIPTKSTIELGTREITVAKTLSNQTIAITAYAGLGGFGSAQVTGEIEVPSKIVPPYAPTSASVSHSADDYFTISWSIPTDIAHPISYIGIDYSINDSDWYRIYNANSNATSVRLPFGKGSKYKFRVRGENQIGLGEPREAGTAYSAPRNPYIKSCRRSSDTSIVIDLDQYTYTATKLEVEVLLAEAHGNMAANQWCKLAEYQGKVSQFTANVWPGLFRFRTRNILNYNGETLISDWSSPSDWISPAHAPDKPTLTAPGSNSVADINSPILFAWRHNPIDGSPQITAELRYSNDGETWATVTVGAAESCALEDNDFDLNSTVQWQVRTKGAYKDFSEWSGISSFIVRSKPVVIITEPNGTDPLENVPLHVSFGYTDASGELANVTASIVKGSDSSVPASITFDAGSQTDFDIPVETFMPENHTTYTLIIQVRSTSTFTVAESRTFQVEFVEPMLGDLLIKKDPETGYVAMTVQTIYDDEREEVVEFSIWRVSESGRKLLAEHLSALSSIVDMYAPLNTDYCYEVVSFAASGVFATNRIDEYFKSSMMFFYWQGKSVYLKYSPTESDSLSRPAKKRVSYPGRDYPVSYDSNSLSSTGDVSGRLFNRNDALLFRELITDGGRCIFKSLDGEVYNADADVKFDLAYDTPAVWGSVSINLVRIDGGLL